MKSIYDLTPAQQLREEQLHGDDPNKIDRSEFKGITKEGHYHVGDEYFEPTRMPSKPEKPVSEDFLKMLKRLSRELYWNNKNAKRNKDVK